MQPKTYTTGLEDEQAAKLIGRQVLIMGDETCRGYIIAVVVTPGGRSYTVEWMDEGCVEQYNFWGFQLELLESE